jgi:hypothetical protein
VPRPNGIQVIQLPCDHSTVVHSITDHRVAELPILTFLGSVAIGWPPKRGLLSPGFEPLFGLLLCVSDVSKIDIPGPTS